MNSFPVESKVADKPKILVCIKSVPDTDKIDFDPETGNMIRGGGELRINPDDRIALETALYCGQVLACSVECVSMGPLSSENALRQTIALGAAEAHLLSDRAFAGADVLATAYTLAAFIKMLGAYHIIVCGNHSADGSTGQTGPELAELLSIPHVNYVSEIVGLDEQRLVVMQSLDKHLIKLDLSLPCLLVPARDLYEPRAARLKDTIRSRRHKIYHYDADQIPGIDVERCGAKGSATTVSKIFAPQVQRHAKMFDIGSVDILAAKIMAKCR